MSDLVVNPIDTASVRVTCERHVAKELSEFFTFKVPGYQFMPAYKNKMWDGTIKLYNMFSETLYAGLVQYVKAFAEERSYTIEINPELDDKDNMSVEQVRKFIDDHLQPIAGGQKINAHDHQVEGVHHAMQNKRCLLLSPTASGKSLMIYALVRHCLEVLPKDKKVLIVVPTTSLVSQMYSDFAEYSTHDPNFSAETDCHVVFAGQDKIADARVIISTWQSIHKMPEKYFENYGAVFGDECHLFKSKSLTRIMSKLKDCPYRVGTTGTLDGTLTHKLVIEGLFGPVYKVTDTKNLMDMELLSNLSIDCILLDYEDKVKKQNARMKYFEELEWLVTHEDRNNFIANMAKSLKGNTLILFQLVEKHGKHLNKLIEKMCPDHQVFFVYGGTDVHDRESIRKIAEENENAIIVASYGTFSTGISIRRLHNIIFASPSKSRIRVLQSIGRQLRKSEHKDLARLYDIGDNLSWKTWKNHTLKHFLERMKLYNAERFDYRSIKIRI